MNALKPGFSQSRQRSTIKLKDTWTTILSQAYIKGLNAKEPVSVTVNASSINLVHGYRSSLLAAERSTTCYLRTPFASHPPSSEGLKKAGPGKM